MNLFHAIPTVLAAGFAVGLVLAGSSCSARSEEATSKDTQFIPVSPARHFDPNKPWDLLIQQKSGDAKLQRGFTEIECNKLREIILLLIPKATKEGDPVGAECFQP